MISIIYNIEHLIKQFAQSIRWSMFANQKKKTPLHTQANKNISSIQHLYQEFILKTFNTLDIVKNEKAHILSFDEYNIKWGFY